MVRVEQSRRETDRIWDQRGNSVQIMCELSGYGRDSFFLKMVFKEEESRRERVLGSL